MTFRNAVAQAPGPVADAYQPGKQALGPYRDRIQCSNPHRFTGSINLDAALSTAFPDAPRWDYGIGFQKNGREVALWIEVHPASTSDVDNVLAKLEWLKLWLRREADALWRLTIRNDGQQYVWIATGGVHIRPGTPQARRLQTAGLNLPRDRIRLS